MTVGSIVQATGAKPYDASKLEHLGYGASPDVVTSHEFEKMLVDGKIACPSDGRTPKRIAYIQCAGSRDENHLNYCSSECCNNTLRQMMEVAKIDPSIENAVIYKDIRAPGHMEYFFLSAQKEAAGMMTRGDVEKIEANGKLKVHVANSMLGDNVAVEADLVVLAVGMVPASADGELIRELHDSRHQAETRRARRSARPRRHAPKSWPATRAPRSSTSSTGRARTCRPSSTVSRTRTSSASPMRPAAPASMPPARCTRRWTRCRRPRTVSARP